MRRSRRIALTVAVATGLLGGAGAAVAGINTGTGSSEAAGSTVSSGTTPVAATGTTGDDAELVTYVDEMGRRASRLQERLAAAQARLEHARTVHAAGVAAALQARAAAAAAAAASSSSTPAAAGDDSDDDASDDGSRVEPGDDHGGNVTGDHREHGDDDASDDGDDHENEDASDDASDDHSDD